MNDQYADMQFPTSGLDLSYAFGAQRPGSTRQGVNVRAYEPSERRARGGSRPGLSRYLDDQPGGAAHLVQHLNYVVDPRAEATTWYDPPYADADNPDGPGIAGGTNPLTAGPLGDGTYLDPSGNRIRYGGTGMRYARGRKASTITLRQSKLTGNASSYSAAFTSQVSTGHLLVAAVAIYGVTATLVGATLSDSLGNSWTQRAASQVVATNLGGGNVSLNLILFSAVTQVAGTCTVTASPDGPISFRPVFALLEYSGNDVLTPFDAASTGSSTVLTASPVSLAAGSVDVNHSGEVAVGVFAAVVGAFDMVFTPTSPCVLLQSDFPLAFQMAVEHKLGRGTALNPAGVFTGGSVFDWLAVGASFRPHV